MKRGAILMIVCTFLSTHALRASESSTADIHAGHVMPPGGSTLPSRNTAKDVLNATGRHPDWIRIPLGPAEILTFATYPDRADKALAQYERAVNPGASPRGQPSDVDDVTLAEHQKFTDGLADRAVHLVRGERPRLGKMLSVTIVDDDVGGPYSIPPRDVLAKTLRASGVEKGNVWSWCMPSRGRGKVALIWDRSRSRSWSAWCRARRS